MNDIQNSPHSPRYVDQGITPIQHRQQRPMPIQEPLLNILFPHRPQKAQPTKLLKLQDRQPMFLRHIPDAQFRKHRLRKYLRPAIEGIRDDPIKHLDEKGEFLQDSTMVMVCEARGIGR